MKRQTGLNIIIKVLEQTKGLSPEKQAEAILKTLEKKQLISPPETIVEYVIQEGVKTPVLGLEWSKSKSELNQLPFRHLYLKK